MAALTLAVVLALPSGGCGTIVSLTEPKGLFGVYSGVISDLAALSLGGSEIPPFVALCILDLPLSFALDTALLPISCVVWLVRTLSKRPTPKQAPPAGSPGAPASSTEPEEAKDLPPSMPTPESRIEKARRLASAATYALNMQELEKAVDYFVRALEQARGTRIEFEMELKLKAAVETLEEKKRKKN